MYAVAKSRNYKKRVFLRESALLPRCRDFFTLFSQFKKKKKIFTEWDFSKKVHISFYRLHMNFKMYRDNDVGTTGCQLTSHNPDPRDKCIHESSRSPRKGSEN